MAPSKRLVSQFMNTVETGDIKRATNILNQGLDINVKDISGISALHRAVATEKEDFVRFLLEKGAYVDVKNDSQSTPMHYAMMVRNTKLACLLADYSPNLNIRDNQGMTVLHHACQQRMYSFAIALLQKGADPVATDNSGRTPLGHLVQNYVTKVCVNYFVEIFENHPIVKHLLTLFLKKSADQSAIQKQVSVVDTDSLIVDSDGMGLLHYACKYQNPFLATILLEKGMDINETDSLGRTPLHLLAVTCSAEISISLLLSKGVKVNEKDNQGATPLHYACKYKNMTAIEELIREGADANVLDCLGRTPLHFLALKPHDIKLSDGEMEKELLQTPVLLGKVKNINVTDSQGLTALHYACKFKTVNLGLALLGQGASVNETDETGKTPLHYLAFSDNKSYTFMCQELFIDMLLRLETNALGHESKTLNVASKKLKELATTLLLAGADPNSPDKSGRTPLHLLASGRPSKPSTQLSVFGPFLQFGADVNAQDEEGCTPLHLVFEPFCSPLLKVLLVSGASLTIKNHKGETPVEFLTQELSPHETLSVPFRVSLERQARYRVLEHVFKLEMAGLPVPKLTDNLDCLVAEIRTFRTENPTPKSQRMSEELKQIRSKIVFKDFSLGLVFSSFGYPYYVENSQLSAAIEKVLDSPHLDLQYPEYCYYLRSAFKLSKERLKLLPKAHNVLDKAFSNTCGHHLPELVTRGIVAYLDNWDLKNIVQSGEEEQSDFEEPHLLCPECALKSRAAAKRPATKKRSKAHSSKSHRSRDSSPSQPTSSKQTRSSKPLAKKGAKVGKQKDKTVSSKAKCKPTVKRKRKFESESSQSEEVASTSKGKRKVAKQAPIEVTEETPKKPRGRRKKPSSPRVGLTKLSEVKK